jgi:uncharacterized protein (TIGR02118 family)
VGNWKPVFTSPGAAPLHSGNLWHLLYPWSMAQDHFSRRTSSEIVRGVGTPDGSTPPYQVIALLSFRSTQDFQNAAQAHGPEIFADIPNFTNVQPVVQINESLT